MMRLKYSLTIVATVLISIATCEETSNKDKIVGGRDASINTYPYQVSLRVNGQHFCGGSIISNRHILTAAHCIVGSVSAPYSNFKVVTGTSSSGYGGQAHNVLRVNTHPQYLGNGVNSFRNDIAIITLSAPITYSSVQKPIKIASTDIRGGESAVITGWGYRRYPNPLNAPTLQQSPMRILASTQCQQYHSDVIYREHVCGFHSQGVGVCMGDSGGPLVVNGEVIGITSWGIPCAKGIPDVYTKVFAYRSYIEQILRS